MKNIIMLLATTILFGLICVTPIFPCELGICDKDFDHDINVLTLLSCDCHYYCGRPSDKDINDIITIMCPGSSHDLEGDCLKTFRQDIKELIRLLCQGPQCPGDFVEDVRVIIRLICKRTECSPECDHNYLKYADKLLRLSSARPGAVSLMGTFNTINRKKRGVISNRLLRVLEQAGPDRFKTLRIGLAAGQLGRAARRSNTSLLMLASAMGDLNIVDELIAKGDNVRAKNKMGKTALIFTASEGHPAVVRTLLKAGADANHKDKDGATAADLARKNGHEDLVKILVGKGRNK